MKIFIRLLTGKTVQMEVKGTETIQNIKEFIFQKEGIPVIQQRYVFSGKQIAENVTLEKLGIQKENVIFLVLDIEKKEEKNLIREGIIEKKENISQEKNLIREGIIEKKENISQEKNLIREGIIEKKENLISQEKKLTLEEPVVKKEKLIIKEKKLSPEEPIEKKKEISREEKKRENKTKESDISIPYRPSVEAKRLLIHFGSEIFPLYCKEEQTIQGLKTIFLKTLQSKKIMAI